MLETTISRSERKSKNNGHVAMDRDTLTQVQWDLAVITQHLQVVEGLVAAAIEDPVEKGRGK